jgi:MFS family permease
VGPPAPAGRPRPEREDAVRGRLEPDGQLRTGPAAAWHVLRRRNFGPYFVGNAASASGTWFQNLAASILVYRLTHSPFLLGVLQFASWAPVIVLSPWAGGLADRVDRKRLLIASQTACAAMSGALALLAAAGLAHVWVVMLFAAGLGVAAAVSQPAQMAMVGSLVPREDLAQAVALNSMTFNVARAVGPAAAAGVIALFGIAAAFAVNSVSYVAFVIGLLLVHPSAPTRAARTSLRDSLRLVRDDHKLGLYLLIVAAVAFASDPINTESPALAHSFGFGADWAGTIVGAFGVGAVVAAIVLAGRIAGTRRRMAATLGALACGNMLFAASPWLELGWAFLAAAGFGYLLSNAAATARLQLGVTEGQRGRIMALWSMAFLGLRPVTSLIDGAIAGAAGVRVAAAVMSLPALLGALAAVRGVPMPAALRLRLETPPGRRGA